MNFRTGLGAVTDGVAELEAVNSHEPLHMLPVLPYLTVSQVLNPQPQRNWTHLSILDEVVKVFSKIFKTYFKHETDIIRKS